MFANNFVDLILGNVGNLVRLVFQVCENDASGDLKENIIGRERTGRARTVVGRRRVGFALGFTRVVGSIHAVALFESRFAFLGGSWRSRSRR